MSGHPRHVCSLWPCLVAVWRGRDEEEGAASPLWKLREEKPPQKTVQTKGKATTKNGPKQGKPTITKRSEPMVSYLSPRVGLDGRNFQWFIITGRSIGYRSHFGSRYQSWSGTRDPFSHFQTAGVRIRRVGLRFARQRNSSICLWRTKLTWLALAEDHAALSRSLEQLTALPRPVKVKRVLLVSLAAKFLTAAFRIRAGANWRRPLGAGCWQERWLTKSTESHCSRRLYSNRITSVVISWSRERQFWQTLKVATMWSSITPPGKMHLSQRAVSLQLVTVLRTFRFLVFAKLSDGRPPDRERVGWR